MRLDVMRSLRGLVCAGTMLAGSHVFADTLNLEPGSFHAIGKVDPRFQSYNVEMAEVIGGRFWAPYPKPGEPAPPPAQMIEGSDGPQLPPNLFRQRAPLDLKGNARLRALAKALGPAYVRVSGTWANSVFFQDDDQPQLAVPPAGFQGVLTRAQWRGVVDFAKAADAKIVSSFSSGVGARDASGFWKPDEARKLLRYTHDAGGEIFAAELVNEPNLGAVGGLPKDYDAAIFAHDEATFRDFLKTDAPALKIVGPGSTNETSPPPPDAPNRGASTEALMTAAPKPMFDFFSYHFYGTRSQRCASLAMRPRNGNGAAGAGNGPPGGGGPGNGRAMRQPPKPIGPEDALTEEWLARTDKTLGYYKSVRDQYMPNAPIWITETAEASCGGDRWAATFLDTFRYVDQMGRLAKQGVAVIFHNTLAASDYALIDDTTWNPRPSYWAAVLWRRIMGETVLDAGENQPGLHVYAHCLRDHAGGVGVVAINLDRARAATVNVSAPAERYTLTADELQSGTVKLNGRVLKTTGNRVPALTPVKVPKGPVDLPPASITLLAVAGAGNAACH